MLIHIPGLDFDNHYVWVLKFNRERKIIWVHVYLNSELLKWALEENEKFEARKTGI
jgi:hypothetical protein